MCGICGKVYFSKQRRVERSLIEKMNEYVFHKLHYSSLPFKDDKEKHGTYSKKLYDPFAVFPPGNNSLTLFSIMNTP